MRVDVVKELMDRVVAAAQQNGAFTAAMAREIERQFRREYKGCITEIHETPRTEIQRKKAVVVDAYLQGRPVDEITREAGISRATLYRYLKK